MATLKDIGNELGLSVTTVSRALNGFPEVSARTRDAVQDAAKRLNYQPNALARKLVSGRSGMVGMVVRSDPDFTNDRSFAEIMIGLSARLAESNVDMVFQVSIDRDITAPLRRLLAKGTLDGFILNGPEVDDARIRFLHDQDVPFVVHGRSGGTIDHPCYDIDNERVSSDSVDLLADLGHRRIGLLNGHERHAYAGQRLRGFRNGLARRGLHCPDHMIRHDYPSEAYGYRAALAMLADPLPPTAIICGSALTADGVLRAARDLGLPVPGKLSVMAHDDVVPSLETGQFDPPLTVTRAPLRDACGPLADILLARIEGETVGNLKIIVPAPLVIRASTGAVPIGGEQPWP